MKVLFFSHQAAFIYGGEIVTLAFMKELGRRGIEVHFASPPGPYQERARECARCHAVPSVQVSRNLFQLPRLLLSLWRTHRCLKKIAREEGIHLIHATSLKAMVFAWWGARNIPTVWHHHDILPPRRMNHWWLRVIAAGARLVLAPSDATRQALLDAGVPEGKCRTLRNGFRKEEWSVRPPRTSYSPFRVALVGEISPRKGTDLLPGILKALRETGGTEGLGFEIIGEGLSDPGFAVQMRASVKGEPVVFLGRREDVKQLLQRIDLLLVPSRQDPLPTVIVEAFFSGVPALGSRAGGIPEMIEDGVSGFLAASEEEFAQSILAARDLARWAELSAGARARAEACFEISQLTDELLGHYGGIHGGA